MVVGILLLGAPSALALPVQAPGETLETATAPLGDGTGSLELPDGYERVAGDLEADADAVVAPVLEVLECQAAVRVPVAILWGDVTDERFESMDLAYARSVVTETVTGQVPIVETVEETVWEPGGLLGFLEPVTREVTRTVGYEDVIERVEQDMDINVHVEWHAEYIDFDGMAFPVLLELPVGLDFLRDGTGDLVQACEGDPVLSQVPSFPDRGDHDVYAVCLGCTQDDPDRHDGWYLEVLSAVPRLAAPDSNAVPVQAHNAMVCPTDVLRAAEAAADGFATHFDGPLQDASEDPEEANAPSSSSGAAVSPSGASTATVGTAGALGTLALLGAGLAAFRRLR